MFNEYNVEAGIDSQQIIQQLEDKIYEHNSKAINKDDGCLFSRIVRDKNKNIVAGVGGWTWANACEITQLWVDKTVRKKGLGKMLLEAAEREAKDKGCLTVIIKSYSFQAPHFYEKHGYRTEYKLDDFPIGYSYYILTKKIG
jgi:GNAT superfamily N-acetyltransferase